jgi:hypothetical protein
MRWCPRCGNGRWVCESHPDKPWLGEYDCDCGGAGAPCPVCNHCDESSPPELPEASRRSCYRVTIRTDDKLTPVAALMPTSRVEPIAPNKE